MPCNCHHHCPCRCQHNPCNPHGERESGRRETETSREWTTYDNEPRYTPTGTWIGTEYYPDYGADG